MYNYVNAAKIWIKHIYVCDVEIFQITRYARGNSSVFLFLRIISEAEKSTFICLACLTIQSSF